MKKIIQNNAGKIFLSLACLCTLASLTGCAKSSDELYGAGMRAMHRGEIEKAFDRFSAAVDANPEDIESQIELAKLYTRREGGREKAVEHFEKVLLLNPLEIEANYYLGILYYQNNRGDAALERFQTVLQGPASEDMKKSANNYRQKILLANIADKNIKELEAALEKKPGDLDLMVKLLKACYVVGQDYLVSRKNMENAEIFLSRYRALRDEVILQMREELSANPKDASLTHDLAETLFTAGEERLLTGELETAMQFFRQAIEVQPNEGKYHYVLAQIAQDRSRKPDSGVSPDDAIYHYREAVKRSPKVALYRMALITSLQQASRIDEAIAELEKMIHDLPNAPETNLARQALEKIRSETAPSTH